MRIHHARTPPGVLKRRAPGRGGATTTQVKAPQGVVEGRGLPRRRYLNQERVEHNRTSMCDVALSAKARLFHCLCVGCFVLGHEDKASSPKSTMHRT